MEEPADGRLRVLVVSALYPRDGEGMSGQFVHRQVLGLQERGVDARVLCPVPRRLLSLGRDVESEPKGGEPRRQVIDGVPVWFVPYRHVPHALSTRLEAASLLRSVLPVAHAMFGEGPQVVHGYWLFPTGYASTRVATELGAASVLTALGSDVHTHPARNRGIARLSRSALRRADACVAVSQALEAQMRDLADAPVRSEVVYNGIDGERFRFPEDRRAIRRDLGLPEGGRGICFAGRLVEEKGLRELTRAFDRLAGRRPDVWLAVVGDGPMKEEMLGWADRSPFADRVFVPGRLPQPALADWMRAADLFVLPSYAEGLPNVVMEAIACGLPVVASDVGGVSEIDDDRRALRLVPPRDVEALVETVDGALEDLSGVPGGALEASRRVRSRFTWERTAERLERIYRDLSRVAPTDRQEVRSGRSSLPSDATPADRRP